MAEDQAAPAEVTTGPAVPSGYTCGSCDAEWHGVSRCHCAGNRTMHVDFVAVDEKKAKVINARLMSAGRQIIGASAALIAALALDPLAVPFRGPRNWSPKTDLILTRRAQIDTSPFTRVSWGGIDGTFVETSDFLVGMAAEEQSGRIVGLTRQIGAGPQATFFLRSTLPRTRGPQPAVDPKDVIRLRISAGCHRTFVGETAFNLHHSLDGCLDPASLTRSSSGVDGHAISKRMLFLNNGLWGSEEHPARAQRETAAANV